MKSPFSYQKVILLFLSLSIFSIHSIAQKSITPCKVKEESICNKCTKKGIKEGIPIGKAKGVKEGYKKGYRDGLKQGKTEGVVEHLEKLNRIDTFSWHYEFSNSFKWQNEVLRRKSNIEELIEIGYQRGLKVVADSAFRNGFKVGFDSIYHINLRSGENIKLKEYDIPPKIEYDEIAKLLLKVQGNSIIAEKGFFSIAVKQVHIEILNYLAKRLDLSTIETSDVFSEYEKMHDRLVDLYYEKYLLLIKNKQIPNKKSFYDYKYYYSVNSFLSIIRSGICSVSDVVITYAKSNTQYAAINGLEVMGHLCEIIMEELLYHIEDRFVKSAVTYDYNSNINDLDQTCNRILESIILSTETQIDKVTETITLSNNFNAKIEMKIETVYNIGFDLEEFELNVNHNAQEFFIFLPKTPKILSIAFQSYKIVKIENTFKYEQTKNIKRLLRFKSEPKEKKIMTESTGVLNEADFEDIFNKNKPTIKDLKTKALKKKDLGYVVDILTKTLEPALALPHSCYDVVLRIGNSGKDEILYKNCN